jgi:hypothetical protein
MPGELTAWIAEKISADWEDRGYDVLHDHGKKGDNINVGKIVSWFGDEYNRETELSQLDIAIAEKGSGKIFALIEIEETTDNPKTLIGDSVGALIGERIMFAGKRELSVDKNTILIVLGQSKIRHQVRNNHIQDRVMEMKSNLSTANSEIGRVIIDSFADADDLDALLPSVLDRAFKGDL